MKIFASNHDIGSSQAIIPVLRRLQERGDEVITFTVPGAPAEAAFVQAGFPPLHPAEYGEERLDRPAMFRIIERVLPDLIIGGVAAPDDGSEKLAFQAGLDRQIPTAMILETWPNAWLGTDYGKRDFPLYSRLDALCVPDGASREMMTAYGYAEERVHATGNPANDQLGALLADRDRHRREIRERYGIPQDALVVLWCVTFDHEDVACFRPDHRSWLGFDDRELTVEFLDAMQRAETLSAGKIRAMVRQKPSYPANLVPKLITEHCPGAVFDHAPFPLGAPPLLASDLVIGAATIVVQTAALLGIPAVYYEPDLCKPDPMATNGLGITVPLYERGALKQLLLRLANDPDKELARIVSCMRSVKIPTDAAGNVVKTLDGFLKIR